MARPQRDYVCQSCGASSAKWAGRCGDCGAWNTLVEEGAAPPGSILAATKRGRIAPARIEALRGETGAEPRFPTAIAEFDRAIGGGCVPGSAILIGGEPGIGKSTLLLQIAAAVAAQGCRTIYVSGEEALQQLRLRAVRLGLGAADVRIAAETNVAAIFAALDAMDAADLVIVDSIQTLWSESVDAPPGTISQVRASAQALVAYAKTRGTVIILVGHVTKDGQIAGPKVVEHMVDTVLYFEGDGTQTFRLLRAVKNRFGPAHEIGVFEMRGDGLREVANPSELFLSGRDGRAPGAAVFAGIEGSRPLLVEIQALVAPSPFAAPRRAAVGWDPTRLAMILAVLDARCGVQLGAHDVYLNVAGGLRISEPAADLAVAAALLSAISGIALPSNCVYFGEVGLSGAIRPVAQMTARLREAEKLGFEAAVIPAGGEAIPSLPKLTLARLDALGDLEPAVMRAASGRTRCGRVERR